MKIVKSCLYADNRLIGGFLFKVWRDYRKVRLSPGSFGYAQDDLRVGRWSRAEGGELLESAALARPDVSTALRFAQHDE